MQTVYKKAENVTLPEIAEATLLTAEELEACQEYIKAPAYFEPNYWYLRTPYEDDLIGVVEDTFEGDPTEPDYEDFPPNGPSGTGLRPVLHLASSTLSDGSTLTPGDVVCLGRGQMFTAISDTMLLSDFMIDYDYEMNGYGIFDEETNIYEDSSAKQRVDAWFELLKRQMTV